MVTHHTFLATHHTSLTPHHRPSNSCQLDDGVIVPIGVPSFISRAASYSAGHVYIMSVSRYVPAAAPKPKAVARLPPGTLDIVFRPVDAEGGVSPAPSSSVVIKEQAPRTAEGMETIHIEYLLGKSASSTVYSGLWRGGQVSIKVSS